MNTPILLEIIGEPQTGKTTVAEQLVHALSPASILLIDASPNQRLTLTMAFEPSVHSLAQVLNTVDYKPGQSKEAIDWAFQELPAPAGQDVEILTLGPLAETLSGVQEEILRYGLPRLLRNYEVVIIDGYHPAIQAVLPEEGRTPVVLTTPQQEYHLPPLEAGRSAALIINRSHNGDALPAKLNQAIEERELRLIGKLPDYATSEERIQKLPNDLHNCLLRLNLPLSLNI